MKRESVTKIDKRYTATSKKSTITSCPKIVTPLSFFYLWPIWSTLEVGVRTDVM